MAEHTTGEPNQDAATATPAISDFANQIRQESRDVTDWRVYENDVFAQVFEFPEHRRIQFWGETGFTGELEGYSWQEQLWTGSSWADSTDISEDHVTRHIHEQELRERLEQFRLEAEATRPENLSPVEAALDRISRRALGTTDTLTKEVNRLSNKLSETEQQLQDAVSENSKIKSALVTLGQRFLPSRHTPRTAREDTGPSTTPTQTAAPGLEL
ncbi:hypothetical protein ACFC14_18735 [Microbacterium sp. NPDC055988]|uniref:hypothetical protein n=1 Tax=Microbacterium sp. NPDC055988 TaxID=3345671 RepID=UPI0035E0FD44